LPSPELPMILPLLFTGVLVGSLLRKTNVGISRKTILLGSLFGGLGNLVHAAVLTMFMGQGTNPPTSTAFPGQMTRPTFAAASATSSTFNLPTFLTTSFIIGLLVVLVVLAMAALTVRLRGRVKSDEEE
jgi:prolipoprotein diacylglyceryltransferase